MLFTARPFVFLLIVFGLVVSVRHTTVGQQTPPATITVNTTADNTMAGDGQCTLREAIANVNTAADTTSGDCVAGTGTGDTIIFTLTLPATITLTPISPLSITRDVTIRGPEDALLVTDGDASTEILAVYSGTATVSNLVIQNGRGGNVGGVEVAQNATLTLEYCTVASNRYGGLLVDGTVTLVNCAVIDNWTDNGASGMLIGGVATLTNCTISGNQATDGGTGGILVWAGGRISLTNCSLANNISDITSDGMTISDDSAGIAVLHGGSLILQNTILGSDPTSVNCGSESLGDIKSAGHNLDSDGSCVNGGGTDLVNVQPRLAPLGYYGGPTQTMALCTAPGVPDPTCTGASPAIDAGDDAVTGPPLNITTDQRGQPRPSGQHVDIGAYEVQPQDLVPLCVGACTTPGTVDVADLMTMVTVSLEEATTASCRAGDPNHDGAITIDEIVAATNNALNGCPLPPTPTPTPSGEFLCSVAGNLQADGQPCTTDSDCAPGGACVIAQPVCSGGSQDGAYCPCAGVDCVATSPACDTADELPGICPSGPNINQCCNVAGNCADNAPCIGAQKVCLGGPEKGVSCLNDGQCPESVCRSNGKVCHGGDYYGFGCVDDADCNGQSSDGRCESVPTATPTRIASPNALATPCTGSNECSSGFCTDGVCCSASPCPTPEYRCDISGLEGGCTMPGDVDAPCVKDTDCNPLLACDQSTGLCNIPPTATPTRTQTSAPPTPTPTPFTVETCSLGACPPSFTCVKPLTSSTGVCLHVVEGCAGFAGERCPSNLACLELKGCCDLPGYCVPPAEYSAVCASMAGAGFNCAAQLPIPTPTATFPSK